MNVPIKKNYVTYLKYEELIKLNLPYRLSGKNWKIINVRKNEDVDEVNVTVGIIEFISPFAEGTKNDSFRLVDKKRFRLNRKQQLKLSADGQKIEITMYSILCESFRKKVYTMQNDLKVLFARRYPTVFKVLEDEIIEVSVNRDNIPILENSIVLACSGDNYEFYVFGNIEPNYKHVEVLSKLPFLKFYNTDMNHLKFICKECEGEETANSFEDIIKFGKVCHNCTMKRLAFSKPKNYRIIKKAKTLDKRMEQSCESQNKKYRNMIGARYEED